VPSKQTNGQSSCFSIPKVRKCAHRAPFCSHLGALFTWRLLHQVHLVRACPQRRNELAKQINKSLASFGTTFSLVGASAKPQSSSDGCQFQSDLSFDGSIERPMSASQSNGLDNTWTKYPADDLCSGCLDNVVPYRVSLAALARLVGASVCQPNTCNLP